MFASCAPQIPTAFNLTQQEFDSITGKATYTDATKSYVKSPQGNVVDVRGLPGNIVIKDPASGERFYMPNDPNSPKPQINIVQKRIQKSKDHSGLVKGLSAVAGGAALANQGADSSIIGEYASNVMNERVPIPSNQAANQPTALERELQKQQRETQERLAGTRSYDRSQNSAAGSQGSKRRSDLSSGISSPASKEKAKPRLNVCSFARVRRKNTDGQWDDIDMFWEISTLPAWDNGKRLKARIKKTLP